MKSPLQAVRAIAICVVTAAFLQPLSAQQASRTDPGCATINSGSNGAAIQPENCIGEPGSLPTARDAKDTVGASAPSASEAGFIGGTVLDLDGTIVPGAAVVLEGASPEARREVTADESGAFKFESVKPGDAYRVTISAKGFSTWTSTPIALQASQFFLLQDVRLKMEADSTSVTVYASTEEIAVEQVKMEEQQRVLGFIPNVYVVYDSANAEPLTPKLKFRLAMKVMTDPITAAGVAMMAGIEQAANRPDYQQGMKGYGQRFGAEAAGGASNILIGGAILPTVLHQDPRYFYQGTGGTRSRLVHALSSPFICLGDNGHRQINFSSMGGDLGATALSMAYFPDSNRSGGQVFATFGINTAERMVGAIAQEFFLPRFTSKGKRTR